jgi:hypothetical protein
MLCRIDRFIGKGILLMTDERQSRRPSDRAFFRCAEMGANLTAVDLGHGRTAVSISLGAIHSCVILVRSGAGKEGLMYAIFACHSCGLISAGHRGSGWGSVHSSYAAQSRH